MKEALFYTAIENNKVICNLCPHNCTIKPGALGICKVRKNIDGRLFSENYALLSAINFDPIEKKPLYHFYPDSEILSLGSVGCNMKCRCCQNWQISQTTIQDFPHNKKYQPEEIVRLAKSRNSNIGVAYTYNEPTIWYEFMLETASLVHQQGMKNVMVSNGFINKEPLLELVKYVDAFNIDLKAFNDHFYRSQSGAKLEPVKDTLKLLVKNQKHVEITNLVIPTLNDDENEFSDMITWIADELGKNTVLHLSRYHPMYKLDIRSTGSDVLEKFYSIASEKLSYVYVGNINIKDYQDTKCSNCGKTVIKRSGYSIDIKGIDRNGNCKNCSEPIALYN